MPNLMPAPSAAAGWYPANIKGPKGDTAFTSGSQLEAAKPLEPKDYTLETDPDKIVATRFGEVSPFPNVWHASNRELDARFAELMAATDPAVRSKLQGECHGIALMIAMLTGATIETITLATVARYKEMHQS